MVGIAAAAFVAIFFLGVPFPLIILCRRPDRLPGRARRSPGLSRRRRARACDGQGRRRRRDGARRGTAGACPAAALLVAEGGGGLPRAVARAGRCCSCSTLGPGNVFSEIAVFFSKMAVVTFGGAYAVLAYVAQAGGRDLRLAPARRDARRPGHGRDDAGAADHGGPVRRLHGRLPRSRERCRPCSPAPWAACSPPG